MITEVRQLDTLELKQRVQRMYEEVALEPEHERADNATRKYGVTSIPLKAVKS